MDKFYDVRPTYVEINLDNLSHNFREIQKIVKEGTIVMPVIKANGYGHGSVELGRMYKELGAERVAVSLLNEGMELRRSGLDLPILILNYTPGEQMKEVAAYDLTQAIYRYEDAKALSEAAGEMGKTAKLHIKIDSGMGRLGFQPTEKSVEEILKLKDLENIEVEGIFTHFAKADELDKTVTRDQYRKYSWLVQELEKRGFNPPIKHVSNSAAIIDLPEYNLDMVRPGIMLYGYYPSEEVDKSRIELRPAMTLKAVVSNIKTVSEGTGISYGHLYKAPRESRIATVPIGYADGYTRMLTGKAEAYVGGGMAPVAGKICMDQLMLDVTDIPNVEIGNEVVFFGEGIGEYPTVEQVAEKLGTVNYEVICMMSRRLPRVYKKDGKVIKTLDYLLG